MKQKYLYPMTDIIPHIAMERIMDATIVSGNNVPIDDSGEGPDPLAQ